MQQEILKFENTIFDFSFFEAIDAKNALQMQNFTKYYQKTLAKITHGRELYRGEIACYASHFSLWEKCIVLDEPIVILEDDVILFEHFQKGVEEIIKSNYSFVRFFALFDSKKNIHPKNNHTLVVKNSKLGGTQGYYLEPSAAKTLVKYSQKWLSPVDDFLDRYFVYGLPAVVCEPYLLKEQVMESMIGYRDKKPRGIFKCTREIMIIYWNVLRFIFNLKNRKIG
ncbi:glycosyltransferase family 25 protein [Helicobacter sp. faydin-H8]|nr:glycosyltransferase family 25 protein [Helicobacter anatolicus]